LFFAKWIGVFMSGSQESVSQDAAIAASRAQALAPLAALCAIARFHQVAADPATLAHQLALSGADALGTSDLLRAAKHVGLQAKLSRTTVDRLGLTPLPALALMHCEEKGLRVVVLAQSDGKRVLFQDLAKPGSAGPTIESTEVFASQWTGELILIASRASLAGALAKFDFTWFVPSLIKYRRLLGEVLLISFMLQLIGLVSPLFFQVVMDKVLVHKGMTTLDVLVIGLVIVVVFESVLNALRAYVFSPTTSRIDVELGSRLFRHLIQLPLPYFQARRVGESIARVRELENIRSFLTGNAMTVLLDVVFSIVFIAVMLFYSVPLTLIVLVSLPLYFGLSLAVIPVLRARLDTKFARGSENQSMLVETVTGIQTVKASALEPSFAKRWDNQLAAYVSASFKTQNLASVAHEVVSLIGKLVNAATLWYGAQLVMGGATEAPSLTVGQFVAFNMFAGRVSQPIMRMAQLWTDFQQTGISVARLGDILNTRTEVAPTSTAQLPALKGRITLDKVVFRYRPEAPPVLNGISLDIRPGEVIGIVGRSGSGKSTLTKLVQRLYSPEGGRLLVDGIDISLIDAAQLRRQVGVVLQENLLFNRSIRENIAIAIARALFTYPRILILDEATSALDYESEAIIQKNMQHICQGRTVLIIAHRLSAVRNAHRIVVMDKGHIVEMGPHEVLIQKPQGLYAHLWAMQDGSKAVNGVATAAEVRA
jgi:ATP-binding cassette, subfamily B, bacterial HlyB/CyaB